MASRFPSVTDEERFVLNNEAILANTKRVTNFDFSAFNGKNKIFLFQNLLKIHESALQKNQEASLLKIEKSFLLYCFFEKKIHFYTIISRLGIYPPQFTSPWGIIVNYPPKWR